MVAKGKCCSLVISFAFQHRKLQWGSGISHSSTEYKTPRRQKQKKKLTHTHVHLHSNQLAAASPKLYTGQGVLGGTHCPLVMGFSESILHMEMQKSMDIADLYKPTWTFPLLSNMSKKGTKQMLPKRDAQVGKNHCLLFTTISTATRMDTVSSQCLLNEWLK
jgi:hypothetical protein